MKKGDVIIPMRDGTGLDLPIKAGKRYTVDVDQDGPFIVNDAGEKHRDMDVTEFTTVTRITPILKHFAYEHLPPHLQQISKPIGELAKLMDSLLPDGPEKSAGLRKLLEGKDALVRARLEQ
jgi:hypothetical protein